MTFQQTTYLLSAESSSSTVAHARRASFDVAPCVLDASKAAAMYSDVSGLVEYKLTDLLTPNGMGLKASTADNTARTRAAENFMVSIKGL